MQCMRWITTSLYLFYRKKGLQSISIFPSETAHTSQFFRAKPCTHGRGRSQPINFGPRKEIPFGYPAVDPTPSSNDERSGRCSSSTSATSSRPRPTAAPSTTWPTSSPGRSRATSESWAWRRTTGEGGRMGGTKDIHSSFCSCRRPSEAV